MRGKGEGGNGKWGGEMGRGRGKEEWGRERD